MFSYHVKLKGKMKHLQGLGLRPDPFALPSVLIEDSLMRSPKDIGACIAQWIAFLLRTQWPQVRILAFPKFFPRQIVLM